ncbi:unnamed protein product [Heterobilharzia americana]|nr:unnamed protein product [Heterobilharzia americana]
MELNQDRVRCLQQWMKFLLPEDNDTGVRDWRTLLKLLDLAKDSNLCSTIDGEDLPKMVYRVLSDFFSVDLTTVIPMDAADICSPASAYYCLLLLALTMGLRLKSKLFMTAAFQLPSTMHYYIVEMTQPLIEDCPISISSFESLSSGSENKQITPIHQSKSLKIPLTCPVASKLPLLPFGHREKNKTNSELIFDDSSIGNEQSYKFGSRSLYSSPENFFESHCHIHKRRNCATKSAFGNDLELEADSPLYSLKSILESPQVIPKGQFLSKLDEIRSLSSKLSELQHLYDENMCELRRLNSELQTSEMRRKEVEVRLKRRESELSELRDELTYEIEMRSLHEQKSKLVDHLQESLNDAQEKLKLMDQLSEKSQKLIEENNYLRAKEKELEAIRSRLCYQQELERQLSQMKVAAELADREIHELLRQREQLLATSEAEQLAQANSLIRNQRSVSETVSSQCDKREYSSCEKCSPSPDSSQPGFDSEAQFPVSDVSSAECLASVVIVNSQLQNLELAVVKAQNDYQSMRRKFTVQRFTSLFVTALAKHRKNIINSLQHSCETLTEELSCLKSLMNSRFEKLCEQLTLLRSHLEESYTKMNEEINKHKKASEEIEKLNLKLVGLERKYNESKIANKKLHVQLDDQINANKIFRTTTEEEIDRLKNSLATSSAEYSSVISSISKEHRREKDQLLLDIKRAEDSKEISLQETANLKLLLENTIAELTDEKEKLTQISALSDTFKSEVADLRASLSKTRKYLLEAEDNLKSNDDRIKSLQVTNDELNTKLSVSENSNMLKEKEVFRLTTRIVELELENKRSSEKIAELESLAESATRLRLDLERHSETLRSQCSGMESGWLSTRMQLSETREQLIKTEELLHETRLRLLRANYEKDEVAERLALIASKNPALRKVRSTLELGSDLLGVYDVAKTETKPHHSDSATGNLVHNKHLESEVRGDSNMGDQNNSGTGLISKACCDVAVQKCDPHSHHWPPFANITAPVSPGTLQNNNPDAVSATSVPLHRCRFGRLIVAPEGEEAKVLKSITYQSSHSHHPPVAKAENKSDFGSVKLSNPSTVFKPTDGVPQPDSEATCSRSVSSTLSYVPETPSYLLNNANRSRSRSAYEIATVPLKLSSGNDSSLVCSDTTVSSASHSSLTMVESGISSKRNVWIARKLHKHPKNVTFKDSRVKGGRFVEPYPPCSGTSRNKANENENSGKSTWRRVWSRKK